MKLHLLKSIKLNINFIEQIFTSIRLLKTLAIIIVIALVASNSLLHTTQALEDSDQTTVTASVPDIVPPSVPFLIAPEDESLLNTGTPTFIWQESTDNVGVSHYQLWLDGNLHFDNIPTTNTSNAFYDLTYNSLTGQYSLTPKVKIADGLHTWRIVAFDAAGNNATSVTWEFTIDTQAPAFVIKTIGPLETNISAQDTSTVPSDPIELEDNEPIFTGTGEANSSVKVTVQIPGQSNQTIEFNIDGSGNWSFQLGILPRDEEIRLDFVITDKAGNISVLTNLKILIIQEFFIFPPPPPPPPTPTPTPTPSPLPSPVTPPDEPPFPPEVPEEPEPVPPIVTPTPPPHVPIIKIPILPPKEIAFIATQIIEDFLPQTVTAFSRAVGPYAALLATSVLPIFSFLALLFLLGPRFIWEILLKILQAIGLLPPPDPQGMVFDSKTNQPVAFAILTIYSVEEGVPTTIVETVVSDIDGFFEGIKLPPGKYMVQVDHQDFIFPTKKERPNFLGIREYYMAEVFEVFSSKEHQFFLIPVDRIEDLPLDSRFRRSLLRKYLMMVINRIDFRNLFNLLFVLTIIITLLFPTVINLVVLGFYCIVFLKRIRNSYFRKPLITGVVKDIENKPVENAIIKIINAGSRGMSLVKSDENGLFNISAKPGKYELQVIKSNMYWVKEGSPLMLDEIFVTEKPLYLEFVMAYFEAQAPQQ
jgi:hypothetical protein